MWVNPREPAFSGVLLAADPGAYGRLVAHFPGGFYTYASGVRFCRELTLASATRRYESERAKHCSAPLRVWRI